MDVVHGWGSGGKANQSNTLGADHTCKWQLMTTRMTNPPGFHSWQDRDDDGHYIQPARPNGDGGKAVLAYYFYYYFNPAPPATSGAGLVGAREHDHLQDEDDAPGCKKPKQEPGPSRKGQPDARELRFEFDVSQTDNDEDVNYFQRTLAEMRQLLRDEDNPYVEVMDPDTGGVRQIHRLPPPEDAPQLMNLTLRLGEETNVTLSVRTDNLYVVGFRSGHNGGTWFEFTHRNPDSALREGYHMITGSTSLGYSGSYTGANSIGGLTEQDMLNAGALVLGMVLTRNKVVVSAPNKRRPKRDADDSGSIEAGVVGLTLAEAVRVVILNINDQHPGYLYGTITVTDGLGAFQLYNRDKDHYEEVDPWVWARAGLAHAPRPISGADDFVIGVDLWDHYRWFLSDRKVASGLVSWNSRDALSRYYNRILKVPVWADHGSVEVQYVLLTNSVVATVKVVLVDSGNIFFNSDVYGCINATTRLASGEELLYTLLNKPAWHNKVRHQEPVPLQRSLISAQLGTELHIWANLWDFNKLEPTDDQIVVGSVDFIPGLSGTDTKEIAGPRGKVRVEVTWSTNIP
uniref:rRNA N-glycosylase n=1 Tax=Aegilops tauschii TaxID=37682 RepID=M8BRV4_AEGTA